MILSRCSACRMPSMLHQRTEGRRCSSAHLPLVCPAHEPSWEHLQRVFMGYWMGCPSCSAVSNLTCFMFLQVSMARASRRRSVRPAAAGATTWRRCVATGRPRPRRPCPSAPSSSAQVAPEFAPHFASFPRPHVRERSWQRCCSSASLVPVWESALHWRQ